MTSRRVLGLVGMLVATATMLGAPPCEARRHPRRRPGHARRCHVDKQCHGGTCNDAGQCCAASTEACGGTCCNPELGFTCCGGACVDTQGDDANCGGCGGFCTDGTQCQEGVCACPVGQTLCTTCVDTLLDDANCGGCGNACPAGQACFLGRCGCADTSKLFCDGQCVDGTDDPNNCGKCGNVCPAGESCVGGACQPPCGPCSELVDGVCVPKDTGGSVCCEWQDVAHYCAVGNQCAGLGCCSPGDQVCGNPNGNAQCCSGNLVCQGGRCCDPDPYPQCIGSGRCWWPS